MNPLHPSSRCSSHLPMLTLCPALPALYWATPSLHLFSNTSAKFILLRSYYSFILHLYPSSLILPSSLSLHHPSFTILTSSLYPHHPFFSLFPSFSLHLLLRQPSFRLLHSPQYLPFLLLPSSSFLHHASSILLPSSSFLHNPPFIHIPTS